MTPSRLRRLLFALSGLLLLPAAVLAQEPAQCTYNLEAAFPLRYVGQTLSLAIQGSINESPALMQVATAHGITNLTLDGATKRKLSLRARSPGVWGAENGIRVWTARISEFSYGPTHARLGSPLYVIGDAARAAPYDATIGADFLFPNDIEIDVPAKRMRMFRSSRCNGVALRPWTEDTIVVPINQRYNHSWNPHFAVLLNGKEVDAVIDSGTERSFLDLEAAKRVGLDVNAPGVLRLVGTLDDNSPLAPRWSVPVKTLAIGEEVVENVGIDVVDPDIRLNGELHLGRDFLRTHRVLLAVGQGNVYLAYVGGQIFPRPQAVPDWMLLEAVNGNADVQYALGTRYLEGNGVKPDPVQARMWMEKAAAQGQPNASLLLGRLAMLDGQGAGAIASLRAGLDQLPTDRNGPLWLYVARVRNGEADLARRELEASLALQQEDVWPQPIARFYLGKLDSAELMAAAGKDERFARERRCQAAGLAAEWYGARGNNAGAASMRAGVQAHCDVPVAASTVNPAAAQAAAGAP